MDTDTDNEGDNDDYGEPCVEPDGTEGLISQLVTLPPPTVAVLVVMSVPFSSVMFSVA